MSRVPSWYTGGDDSGRVAEIIDSVSSALERDQVAQATALPQGLRNALELETEPNWQALLVGLSGMLLDRNELADSALGAFRGMIELVRPELPTFHDILNVYCQACFHAAVASFEKGRREDALSFALRALPFAADLLTQDHVAALTLIAAECFAGLGHAQLSLALAVAAVALDPTDRDAVGILQQAYTDVGLSWKAEELGGNCAAFTDNVEDSHRSPS